MTEAAFIGQAILEMVENGVSIHLLNKRYFKGGYSGWYISNTKSIEIATKDPAFLDVFVHEYCHFKQHTETPKFYAQYGHCKFVQWLTGFQNQATAQEVDEWLKHAIILEHDCEKRVLKLIDTYQLPLNKELYIKGANAYMFAWWYAREFHKMPSNLECVFDLMPTHMKNVNFYYNRKNYLGEIRDTFIRKK